MALIDDYGEIFDEEQGRSSLARTSAWLAFRERKEDPSEGLRQMDEASPGWPESEPNRALLNDALAASFAVEDWKGLQSVASELPARGAAPLTSEPGSLGQVIPGRWERGGLVVEQGKLGTRVMHGLATPEEERRWRGLMTRPAPDREYKGAAWWADTFLGPMVEQTPIMGDIAIARAQGAVAGGIGGLVAGPGGIGPGARVGSILGGVIAAYELEAGNAYTELWQLRAAIEAETGERIPDEVLVGLATTVGGVNAWMEYWGARAVMSIPGVSALFGAVRGVGLRSLLESRALRSTLGALGRRVLTAAVREGGTEIAQELSNVVAGRVLLEAAGARPEDFGLDAGAALDRLLHAGIEGALGGVGISFALTPVDVAARRLAQRQASAKQADALNRMVDGAKDHPLRQNAPEALSAWATALASEAGADPNVYIDAAAFTTFFQEQGVETESLGIEGLADQVPAALGSGGELVVPLGEYLAKLADYHEGLAPFVRQATGVSPTEAAAQESDEVLEQQARELEGEAVAPSEVDALVQGFVDRIVQSGAYPADQAETIGTVLRALTEARAERIGPRAYEDLRRLQIQGPADEAPAPIVADLPAAPTEAPTETLEASEAGIAQPLRARAEVRLHPKNEELARFNEETGHIEVNAEFDKLPGEEQQAVLESLPGVPLADLADLPVRTQPMRVLHAPQERGSLTFDAEMQTVILRLTESRNLSTALHELSHLYFLYLARDAGRADADPQIRADLQTLLEFVGVEAVDQLTTEHYETLARAQEAYYFEGKAPSEELRGAFGRILAWMLWVYRRITALGVQLTPEVRAVFDRMHASQAAIEQARASAALLPAFDSADAAGMTEAEYQAYAEALERVNREAEEALDREVLEEYRRLSRAEETSRGKTIRAEVEAELRARPAFRAREWLRTGVWPGEAAPPGLEPRKLSRQGILDALGPEAGAAALPKLTGLWVKEGGIHPDELAALFGMPSGDVLLGDIMTLGPLEEAVRAQAKARLEAEIGDMTRDGTIAEKALEAHETDARGRFLVREVRALARRAGAAPTPASIAREAARRIIGEKRIRDLRPGIHRAAAERMARAAAEAIAAGDWEAAHDAKRKQLLAHYLTREATRARDRAERQRRWIQRQTLTPNARRRIGKAGESYLDQIDALLDRFDFRRISNRAADRRAALAEWITEQEQAGHTVTIDPKLRSEAFRRPWRELTVDEFTGLHDSLRNIAHLAKLKRKLILAGEERDFEETIEDLEATILTENEPVRGSPNMSPDLRERFKGGLRRIHAWHTKMEFLFEKLDGHKQLGPVWRALFKPFVDAEAAESEMRRELAEKWTALMGKIPRDRRATWKVKRTYIPEIGLSLTLEEMIAVALNMGNEYNRAALQEGARTKTGQGWTDDQLAAVVRHLTDADLTVVQDVWNLVESYWPQIAELERRVSGVAPVKVKPEEVVINGRRLSGGYYPLKANPTGSMKAYLRNELASARDLFANQWARAMTRHGHTIERTSFAGQEVWLSLNVVAQHLENVIHDLTHREAILAVNQITSDKRFQAAVQEVAGFETVQLFRPWLQSIAGDVVNAEFVYDRFIAHARHGVSISYMGLKFTTMFAQLAGVGPSIDRVGLKPMVKSFLQFLTGPRGLKERVDFALERSPLLRNRLRNFDREARDLSRNNSLTTTELGRFGKDAENAFIYTIGLFDMFVSVPTWLAAYQSEMDATADEATAIQKADQAVRFSQGTGSVKDLSRVQRGSNLVKLFTAFYSYFATFYNQFANRVSAARSGAISLPQAAASAFWIWFAPALVSELLAGRGPDDEEEWWKWAAVELGRYPAMGVVGLRDVVNHAVNIYRGKHFDFDITPVNSAFESLAAPLLLLRDLSEGEIRRSTMRGLFEAAGYWGHLPARQMWITTEAFYDWMTNQGEVLPQDFLFTRPQERRP